MKILELHSLTYSYDKNKKILKSINAQMETGKMYAILGPSGCFLCLEVWTAPQVEVSYLKGRTLHRSDWQDTERTMFRLFFRATI